jgi:hypothetical protein
MKHISKMTTPKPADCNPFQSFIVGKIATDSRIYDEMCRDKNPA